MAANSSHGGDANSTPTHRRLGTTEYPPFHREKALMSQFTVHTAAIAFMICCAAEAPQYCDAFAASPKLVEFEGAPQALDSLQQRLARERGEGPKGVRGDRLRGLLAKPEGDGPFPAIVGLHGCSGLPEAVIQPASEGAVSRGYVMLLVDSFTTRGIDHTCTPDRYAAADIFTRTRDAYGALLFLARQPFVDAHHVAVAGASQGGMVTLSVTEARSIELFVNPSNLGFRAAIALYPGCGVIGARPSIPTLILVGDLDDWTPARDCERALAHWGNAGAPIELVTYRGAHHAFDVEFLQPGRMMFGHWTEYNAKAAEDARRRIYAFLTEHFEK
jgi:dienelactone hydrolase